MRLRATIMLSLKGLLAQWKQVLLMYAVFPLLLATSMGYFQRDVFKPDTSMDIINITFEDKDNSDFSRGLIQVFKAEGIGDLFNIKEDGDYVVTIPEGYERDIMNLEEVSITVDERERASRSNELIIKAILEQYGKHLTSNVIIADRIESMDTLDKERLHGDVIARINEITSKRAVKNNIIKGERTLNSYENQAAALMTYLAIMMIMGCVAGHHLDLENGSFRRLISTPMKKTTMFNLNIAAFFIFAFVYGIVYVITMRVMGYAFIGTSILNLGALLLCQSLLIAACAGFMTAFFKKTNGNIIMIIVMYYQILFGGVFIPLKDITSKVFMFLSRFSPGNVISSAYRNIILYDSFDKIFGFLAAILMASAVFYVVSILKVRVRWEE